MTSRLRFKILVFDNGRLGMVKLGLEQGGLPEFGTERDDPDEISLPPKATVGQGWGFAIA